MSRPLDALLAELAVPPVPAGLAARTADAALAQPQAPALPGGRTARRDRRGGWLRRPLIAGGIALGLAFSGAVAATLAGVQVELPPKVQTALAEVPFFGRMAKAEAPVPPPAPVRRRVEAPPAQPTPVAAESDVMPDRRRERAVRRWLIARQIVAERRAAGLPTPRADRIEWAIEQRLVRHGVLPAEPVERAEIRAEARRAWQERRLARREARAARLGEPDMAPPAAAGTEVERTEELNRLALRRARAERMRAVRFERLQRWREHREERLRALETEAAEETEAPAR